MEHPGVCASCIAAGGCRLGLGEMQGPDLDPRAIAVCPPEFEGGPTTAHGGWIAAIFDDFLGKAMVRAGHLSVTTELTVRFLKPVPVGPALELTGRVIARDGDRWRFAAEMHQHGTDRKLATAEGTWLERGPEHWERHQQLLADQGV